MRYSYVLWDFNGTIVDDVDTCIEIINILLQQQGKEIVSKEQYRNVFMFPVIEYYKRVGVIKRDEEFVEMAHRWMDLYYEREATLTTFHDIHSTLEKIKKLGIKQGVLSASRIDQLQRMVDQFGVGMYMDDILGISDIYATSKVHIGLEFIEKSGYDKASIVMIGDTIHDFEVATQMGIDCILVSRGHQSIEVLASCGVSIVSSAEDVVSLLV
ncbi:MAG: HAD hydrolase-like protein [Erysipelotrichales bacterium]|nr:HAD hydrolase-like protein [Erysipelotrichales bacterium]